MSYYLTDCIFIKDHKTFYEENNKIKKVTKNNWHNYLYDYGWNKLSLGWKRRLKEPNNKNSCFGVLDCGGDGDCLFHVLCEALNSEILFNLDIPKYSVTSLRKLAANQINKHNFDLILETYKIEYSENIDNFDGIWNPYLIESIDKLRAVIKEENNFWGDHILIQLLQKKLKINIIILNSDNNSDTKNLDERFTIHPLASKDLSAYKKTIVIYYIDQYHFQLIGYFNGDIMMTLFDTKDLPKVLVDVYNNDCRN